MQQMSPNRLHMKTLHPDILATQLVEYYRNLKSPFPSYHFNPFYIYNSMKTSSMTSKTLHFHHIKEQK